MAATDSNAKSQVRGAISSSTERPFGRLVSQLFRRAVNSRTGGQILVLALFLATWQLIYAIGAVPPYVLPSPSMVARATIKYAPLLWSNGLVTLREILLGFVLGSAAGLIIGSAISLFKPLERVVYPALVSSQSIPKLAIAPLLVVWFGYGATTIIIVAVLVTVFPVVVNTMLGLQSVSPEMLKLGKVMGGSPLRIFLRIRIPTAMPSVFAGLKLGITNATIGAVVGEFVAASSGLAYLLQDAAGTVKTDLVFATVIVLAVMGVALFGIVQGVEQFVTRKYGGHS